ncbi:lysophospholipid acyltransferase family protein [Mucilaginibacter corticis]|uniref:Lysophospholipid acyltransferase family protein n=1 Tax=Mucilaginibacter corticis TaxID=2597670 RepID=A0A556ML81_9SPHI|nr:lysophospholipid acyltransferase family protein [Mucilaginibacter corticis]TSJ40696.1 lysophospholipid acyltransferase family protein [Mucilaginibacter corticis]
MIKNGLLRLAILLLYLISLLPFWLLYIISDFLYILIYYIVHYRRRVVKENLKNSFPEKSKAELKVIEKQFFRYFADFIVETVKAISISEKELRRRVVLTNPEVMDNYYAQGRSIIAVGGHYCNWELAGLNFYFYTDKKFMIVYKPLSNAIFDKFFYRIRSRFGTIPVSMRQTLRKVIEVKNELSAIALLGDQTPSREEVNQFVEFLNQPTPVFLGIEKLAMSTDSVVVYYDMKRIKRGYYSYTLIPLFEEPKKTAPLEITKTHVKHLEDIIKQEPQYWLWSHRRWKFKPEDLN